MLRSDRIGLELGFYIALFSWKLLSFNAVKRGEIDVWGEIDD